MALEGGDEGGFGRVVDFGDFDAGGDGGGGGAVVAGQRGEGVGAELEEGGDDEDADCAGCLGGRVLVEGVVWGESWWGEEGERTPTRATFLMWLFSGILSLGYVSWKERVYTAKEMSLYV